MESLGIYVHIPYCLQKCRYCDFVSEPLSCAAVSPDEYANRVCRKIEEKAAEYPDRFLVDTVFFGGGTPTCIGTDLLGRILLCIRRNFRVAADAEISIEANPETVTEKLPGILRFLGFNRVSMGVQSLNDGVLQIMGRVHNADKARIAYRRLRQGGFDNINLDLMLGVPGQTFEIWKETLDEVIDMAPEHLSFYSLQLEEGTPFFEDYRAGLLDVPEWSENRRMYRYAVESLKKAGYHHYEISNAAKPGFECRHNLKYWTMQPYLGFGTAAHSFLDGRRTDDEHPDLKGDFVFTELRLIDGFDPADYRAMFGSEFTEDFCTEDLVEQGLLYVGDRIKLTEKGLDYTNPVMEELLNG